MSNASGNALRSILFALGSVGCVVTATGTHWDSGLAVIVGFMLIGEFGPTLGLAQGLMNVSPFGHVPRLPGAYWQPVALATLTLIAVGLMATGASGFRRRDIG